MARLRRRRHPSGLSEYRKADIALLVAAAIAVGGTIALGYLLQP